VHGTEVIHNINHTIGVVEVNSFANLGQERQVSLVELVAVGSFDFYFVAEHGGSFPLDDVANLTANEADRGDDEPEGGEDGVEGHGGYFLSVLVSW
jgi:hypothetical protein